MKKIIITILLTISCIAGLKAQTKNYEKLINQAISSKDSALAVSHLIEKFKHVNIEQMGPLETIGTNNQVFNILFKFSNDQPALIEGVKFMEKLKDKKVGDEESRDQIRANFIDTYANLLYKAGKVGKAISWQKKAIAMASAEDKPAMGKILDRMKKGLPTW